MAKKKKSEEKPQRVEAESPRVIRRAKCGICRGESLHIAYTQVFRESHFRRITAHCQDCGAINWWDEELTQ